MAVEPEVPQLEELVASICRAHGVELVQVRRLQQPGGSVLRVFIDRERPAAREPKPGSGVNVGDCRAVSRDLSVALELHESLVPGRFRLEVSSPGLERPLVKLADFERFRGREARVETAKPVGERRKFQGVLVGVVGTDVQLEQDGAVVRLPFEEIRKANLVYRF